MMTRTASVLSRIKGAFRFVADIVGSIIYWGRQ